MKLVAFFSALVILSVIAISLLVTLTHRPGTAPGFVRVQPSVPLTLMTYDFLSPRPFDAGRMWIATKQGCLVYDIDRRQVVGQITNAWPEMLFGDSPRLLCCQPSSTNGLKQQFFGFVASLSHGRIRFPPQQPGLTYWLLDLANDTAKKLGDIQGYPNSFYPSPDSHYSFTTRTAFMPEVYLFDLQRPALQKIDVPGWPVDWWNNTQILVQTTNSDFVLYDVGKRAITPFIGSGKIADFLKEKSLSGDFSKTHGFTIWNGQQNDFYLTDTQQKWLAKESFLVKVERPDGKLKLVSSRFKFEWSDHLEPTGRYYLFSGREPGDRTDGVFLRDLSSGTNRILVAPTTNRDFSIPRFYRDSAIYIRSNALWQISLDGSNTVRLFPPLESHGQNQP